ncbi:radical SAM protein [Patescibacteria group bacterium]|nr:radical SAM protein [Patescibacteria group bacterium]MBU2472772.1 radical SAM protein [Patescibacteria group bacterium]
MSRRIVNKKNWGAIILSPGCDNDCFFCGLTPNPTAAVLREQEIKVFKNLVNFKTMGIKNIEISGSDPIEYDEIISLIKYIKKIGFEFIQLSTHGKKLAEKPFLTKLAKAGLDKVRIPLYGSQAEIHDAVTRTKGSFSATLKGIKGLLKDAPNIQICIGSLIVQQNKNDLTNLLDLIKKLKINDFYFSIPCIANNDYSYYVPFKNLRPYVKKIFNYANKINYSLEFFEIPYCVFGQINKSINNTSLPPDLGKYCQPSEENRTSIKDLPKYRMKKKVAMCKGCKCANFCDGFFVNDIDKFGIGNIKPIGK